MAADQIKQEITEFPQINITQTSWIQSAVIEISDSDSDSDEEGSLRKKPKIEVVLPAGFLDPLPPATLPPPPVPRSESVRDSCKQFWKAGDYEGKNGSENCNSNTVGMDHLRVHPKFLHTNATSHKWALGAFAELLDNALDEVCNGATYVHVDMLKNPKDGAKMLLVEDDGGGMNPATMRQCMSLGYSVKSKLANTIGQYGNGFKTSTMRLGADVIVFSRHGGKSGTQSVGMLSYTFLRRTGKEDIVVPMVDYERTGQDWKMAAARCSPDDWKRNLGIVLQWSPFGNEEQLLKQFDSIKDHGTRIIIYNLWEDDGGELELDFDADHDIQIRGVNRDEKKIEMAKNYPNSRHFLTYRHSLRSYAAILYLRIPPGFRIILRGKDVVSHNLVDDMMLSQEIRYKPVTIGDGSVNDQNMGAVVTIGFVKDAKHHIDVQGFNVYHKNRLIKPFWRVWNAAGSDGRGVIGVLEANFVEPAHDKQGFERTIVLSRLENRLVVIQKNYWSTNCHHIGYAKRRHSKKSVSPEKVSSPLNSNSNSNSDGHDFCDGRSKFKGTTTHSAKGCSSIGMTNQLVVAKVKEESRELGEIVEKCDGLMDLQHERERSNWLEDELRKARQRIEEMDREQETIFNVLSEEMGRRDREEEILRKSLKDASDTIEELINKVKFLEGKAVVSCKIEPS